MLRWITTFSLLIVPAGMLSAQDQPAAKQQAQELAKLREQAEPGQQHARLKKLAGSWNVAMKAGGRDAGFVGSATAEMILGDRFLVIDGQGNAQGQESAFRYNIGFDRRHEEFIILAMDTTGTYPVSARGKPTETGSRMFGTDDDPHMKKLGFVKKFAFDLEIKSDDEFSIFTLWVDTRTKEEKLLPAFQYVFTRKPATP
jgi:hypothetical protein